MSASYTILLQSLVRPFYRQNAGLFLFLFILFFGIVAPSNQLAYHYTLIMGLLETPVFFGLVVFAWLAYALKCSQWIRAMLQQENRRYLHLLCSLDTGQAYRLMIRVQLLVYAPVWGYALIVTAVACCHGWYISAVIILLLNMIVIVAGARLHLGWVCQRGERRHQTFPRIPRVLLPVQPYWLIFIRYLLRDCRLLVAGIKLFSCCLLILLLRMQTPDDYDLRMPYLLFTMALFGHGVLIYRCREMEDQYLLFYRGLPLSLTRRWVQYMILNFLVLVPEMLTIGWLTPSPIHFRDAFGFILSGYAVLLLLHSLLFIAPIKMSDYLKCNLGIFGILYVAVLADDLIAVSGFFFLVAGCLFYGGYRRYNK